MEETLTDCLVRVREDLNQLKKVRDYLETNAETEERCSVTWRTIEAFNSILSVCSSQNSPETPALDTLLDSFFYLARNNTDSNVWDDFGFELGIICVKVLSAIERTKIFEVLLCKLLSIIGIICEYNANIWKTTARQILNVLINKKIPLSNLETILKLYISILRQINDDALCEFSSQNLHLLKTLFLLVQKTGDFEIQSNITELVYLHLAKNPKLMTDIFEKENLTDFENGCRLYLNSINKSKRGCERKVYSICCHVLYLGGCFVEPPAGRNFIWVDANKDTERLSINHCDSESEGDRMMYVSFSNLSSVQFEKEKTEGNLCLTIKSKNQKDLSGDICLVTENVEGVYEFVQFLETEINVGKKNKKKSKTMDTLVIDRNFMKVEVQDNAVTSSEKTGLDQILPDVFSLFEKANQTPKELKKSRNVSQELSPNSFVESLNKHIGMDSFELRQTFEDSIETIEFLQKSTPGKGHKLFRSPDKIFDVLESNFAPVLEEEKENKPIVVKTYSRRPKRVLKSIQNLEGSQSQDCFRGSSVMKKKPFLPKLKRTRTASKGKERKKNDKANQLENETKAAKVQTKTSLLDPNGYAYQRWCKPTTSERSNFWLKKLDSLQKSKTDSEHVFDFSEESDSIFGKNKKRRVIHSKRKCRTKKETKQVSLREVKNIIKKASPIKEKEMEKPREKSPKKYLNPPKPHEKSPEQFLKLQKSPTPSEKSPEQFLKLQKSPKPREKSSKTFLKLQKSPKPREKSYKTFLKLQKSPKPREKSPEQFLKLQKSPTPSEKSPKEFLKLQKLPIPHEKSPKEFLKLQKSPKLREKSSKTFLKLQKSPKPREKSPEELLNPQESPKWDETPTNDSEYESLPSSDDEELPSKNKKRERSEETSLSKLFIKKKQKISLPKSLQSSLRRRFEKDRRYTSEIIKTFNKATNHLFNHLQRKDGEKLISYLKTAEEVSLSFEAELDDLNVRVKRIQRAILYFKAGCSVGDFCEFLDGNFSKVRDGMRVLKERKDNQKSVQRICNRLSSLIGTEVEKSLKAEWILKGNKLLKYASILGSFEPEPEILFINN